MSFDHLGLSPDILQAVAAQGYTAPTPIQEQAVPVILAGRDVMGAAQTGTGKTAAFTLPILERLRPLANTSMSPARHPVRTLILTPTRELAVQVEESVRTYGKNVPLRYTVVYGGVSIDPQIAELRRGVEILVATPGRLLDHVHQKTVNLGQVQILVLDEADRMLDMGFMPDIQRILSLLPAQRQNLLFSATFSEDIRRLAKNLLHHPVQIEVTPKVKTAERVEQVLIPVDPKNKRELLVHLIRTRDLSQSLVFSATKLGANRLARELAKDGVVVAALHSDKTQPERTQALADFKEGRLTALVATDIAARGLDIEQLPHVINYDVPRNPEDYVHRIGRTGRAGLSGEALTFVTPEEERQIADIEKLIGFRIPRQAIEGFEPGAARPSRRDRPRDSREPRESRREPRPAHRIKEPPKPAAPPEPEWRTLPPDTPPAPASTPRRRHQRREVPAILGGRKKD